MPGDIGGTKNQDPGIIVSDTVDLTSALAYRFVTHLDQELGLYTPARFTLPLSTGARQRVDFIDEDDGWFLFSGHGEELLDESGTFSTCLSV